MSIEHILKQANRTKRKKRHRGHGIHAVDERYTGSEPVWDDWETWPVAKFHAERCRAMDFYNYYSNAGELKPAVVEWMESHGYSKDDVKAVKRAPDYFPGVTAGSLCMAMNRGMPALHPGLQDYLSTLPGYAGAEVRSDENFVREKIAESIIAGSKISLDDVAEGSLQPRTNRTNPIELLKRKVQSTIVMDLDVMLDAWMDQKDGEALSVIDIYARMREHCLPAMAVEQVKRWISRHLDEMVAARDATDSDLVQGYSYLSKNQIKERISAFEKFISDLDKFKSSAKATRAPREKKLPSATKQVERLRYLKDSPENRASSINPVRVIGAQRLLTFDTGNRMLCDYRASGEIGLQLSGSTLKNVDATTLRAKRLRKPERDLQTFVTGSEKAIDKLWTSLTTKEIKQNTRINQRMILLRVL